MLLQRGVAQISGVAKGGPEGKMSVQRSIYYILIEQSIDEYYSNNIEMAAAQWNKSIYATGANTPCCNLRPYDQKSS